MAMRLGHRICSHVRNSISPAVSTPLRGRSYCSGSISPVSDVTGVTSGVTGFKGLLTWLGASSFVIWTGWFYRYDVFNCRTMVEDWRAEMKVRGMMNRLNRDKLVVEEENYQKLDSSKFKSRDDHLKMIRRVELESDYAYLEMLEREANAMNEALFRRELGDLDVKIYEREIAALRAMIEKTRAL